jgi:Ni/Co efflux regulator RcnB
LSLVARERKRLLAPPELSLGAALLVALAALAPAATFGQPRDPGWERFGPGPPPNGGAALSFGQHGLPPPPPPGGAGRYHPHYGRWWPGQTLPPDAPATVLADPARFHLRPAPPGYLWLLCDGDLMLASSASGLIVEVIPAGVY